MKPSSKWLRSAALTVRLYTDAGLKDGVGSWAFVIVVPDIDRIEGSGLFRSELQCTATAEARAVANALHRLIRSGYAPAGTSIDLYCDHRVVVERIEGRCTTRPGSPAAKAVVVIRKMAEVHGLKIKARWIKGHRPDDAGGHARNNNRCDQLCREARKLPPPPPSPSKARRALMRARALEGRS
jgi:ribonuclease HI